MRAQFLHSTTHSRHELLWSGQHLFFSDSRPCCTWPEQLCNGVLLDPLGSQGTPTL